MHHDACLHRVLSEHIYHVPACVEAVVTHMCVSLAFHVPVLQLNARGSIATGAPGQEY